MLANVRREVSRIGVQRKFAVLGWSREGSSGRDSWGEAQSIREQSEDSLGEGLPGSRGTQGKAHIAGLAWDVQGTASSPCSGSRGSERAE